MRITLYWLTFLFLSLLSCRKDDSAPLDAYWQKEDPALHGFQPDSLQLARTNAAGLTNLYALLVVRHNKLVVEDYFHGKGPNDLLHLRSITKTITSALAGIALEAGALPGIDTSIKPFYPDLISGAKDSITLRHLLNMSSGLSWDEETEVVDLIENRITDPVRTLLSRNLSDPPGAAFNYNSVSPHVVAQMLAKLTQQTLLAYAEDRLFAPLSITRKNWERDPQGAEWGGFGLQLTARDLAKFGQLYLNGGAWEGRQIVPPDWVAQSAIKQIQPGTANSAGYSFQWWTSTSLGTPIFYGQGFGGQGLFLIPEKDLLIVALQDPFVSFDQSARQWNDLVGKVFYPVYRAAN